MNHSGIAAWAAQHPARRSSIRMVVLLMLLGSGIGLAVVFQPRLVLYAAAGLGALGGLALAALLVLRAPELLFALYMSIGSFKATLLPLQARLGFDLTVALALLLLLALAIRIVRSAGRTRFHWPTLLLYLLLAAWMAFSLIWSPDPAAGSDKLMRFATLTLLALLGPMALVDSWPRLERFLWALFLLGMVFTARAVASLALEGGWRRLETVLGADYLVLGQVCGLTALLGVYLLMDRDRRWWLRATTLAAVAASVLIVVISGARGPLLAWTAAFAAPALFSWRPGKKALAAMGLMGAAVLLFAATWTLGLLPPQVTFRFEVALQALLLRDPQALQLFARTTIWQAGWQSFQAHPLLGLGAGGYLLPMARFTVRYPHNLFLEAGAELGIVGLLLVLPLILLPLIRWRQCSKLQLHGRSRLLFDAVLAVSMFFFVGVLKSGDFNSNRTFWMSLGLLLSACLQAKSTAEVSKSAGGEP